MIRSNVGNVVTNAVQIGSVGLTTASRVLGRADSALNNLSKKERSAYYKMKANKLRDETREYETGGASMTQHLSEQELTDYRAKQAEKAKEFTYGKDEEESQSVDDLMLQSNSPQVEELSTRIKADLFWNELYKQNKEKGDITENADV